MEIIDNINRLLGDDLKKALVPESKLKIAASCFYRLVGKVPFGWNRTLPD